jgi:FixJ family two-component response regulator
VDIAVTSDPLVSIIDDDAWSREGIKDLVSSLGYRTAAFASAEEFVRSEDLESTSCVISDLHMPGLNGLDLQDYLAKRGRKTPVILVTAFPDEKKRALAFSAGAYGFLTKPFDEKSLVGCLTAAFAASH